MGDEVKGEVQAKGQRRKAKGKRELQAKGERGTIHYMGKGWVMVGPLFSSSTLAAPKRHGDGRFDPVTRGVPEFQRIPSLS